MFKRIPNDKEVVKVYRNLHKKMLSVMDRTGKVIGWAHGIILEDVKFIVRPAGRKKVLETKRKNVHAFAQGKVVTVKVLFPDTPVLTPYQRSDGWRFVSYNPYKAATFMDSGNPIHFSKEAAIDQTGIWVR